MTVLQTFSTINKHCRFLLNNFKATRINHHNVGVSSGGRFNTNYFTTSCHNQSSLQQEKPEDSTLWIRSKFQDLKPCVGMTVPELIRDSVGVLGCENAIAFECAETGIKYTYNQVLKQSRGFAASLIKSDMGFKRGDVVAIMAHNIPEYCAILFGIWDAGLIPTTVNPAYTTYEIKHQLESMGAKGIVTLPQYLPLVRNAKTELPGLKSIIIVGEAHEGCHTYFEMAKTDSSGIQFSSGSQMDTVNDTAILLSSSGTTGPPKGVMLTHSSIATNILQYNHPCGNAIQRFTSDTEQSKLFAILPLFHAYGLAMVMLTSMFKGAHTMTLSKFSPDLFTDAIRRHKPTDLHLVSPLVSFITQNDKIKQIDLDPVKSITLGAAPIGPTIINQLLEKAGKFVLFQEGYGMTELSPLCNILAPDTRNTKIGSTGTLIPLTMSKIVDVATGNTLPRFKNGEICIKGPQVMKGYFKNEEATRNTIDPDGWLHTGDIGYYDNDDCLYIVDRLKELIKVKGFQVAPSELEDLLRSHDKVADVAVIGVPDAESGELPRAYIVPKKYNELSEKDINDFVKDKVTSYKHLRGGIEFLQEIPKTASGKILRKFLLAGYKEKRNIK